MRLLGTLLSLCAAVPVLADLTAINPAGEPSHVQVFESLYGESFTPMGPDFMGASLTIRRVDDLGGSSLKLLQPELSLQDDRTAYSKGVITATARARVGSDAQYIGFVPGAYSGAPASNSEFVPLFQITGSRFNVQGTWSGQIDGPFRWARRTNDDGLSFFTSDARDNLDNDGVARDQLVTYQVLDPTLPVGTTKWVLLWEDRILGQSLPDYDFNDAIVELVVTPEPASLALLAAAVLFVRRR